MQNDTYFALPTADTTVSLAGLDAIEQATTDKADWWDPDSLDADRTAVTEELTDLMRDAIRTVSQRKARAATTKLYDPPTGWMCV